MENLKLCTTGEGFLIGYVNSNKAELITDTLDQVAAFVCKYHEERVVITSVSHRLLVESLSGFIMHCDNESYAEEQLVPLLTRIVQGDEEVPKFTPHILDRETSSSLHASLQG